MPPSSDIARLPPLVRALLGPDMYPHRPATVDLVQTHISYVFLAGDEVYKVKKPVRFAFLDFSTLERRRHFCREEVRLNRRLAPDVYRGVVAIQQKGGVFALAAEDAADAVEYAVHMRRLPGKRMLSRLLDRGAADGGLIDAIAARLSAFHAAADAGPEVARGGDPAVIAALMENDFREVDDFRGETIDAGDDDAIRRYARRFLDRNAALFSHRQAEGRIRDGHGDLHAEHICCIEGLPIFDCVEFNPDFRRRDVAAEIAFLAMDLDYHGRADLAARLVTRYGELTRDPDIGRLVPFYACQRAYIRGKVDSLKSAEAEVEPAARSAARRSATRHFALAYRYTWSATPLLLVTVGLSGTGKSTVAAALSARTGFPHINSDTIRKRLAGLSPTDRAGPDLYTAERSAGTYAAMYAAAAQALAGGGGAIVDGTFQRRIDRDAARDVARQAGVPILFVECICPAGEVHRRLAERARRDDDASDADWAIHRQQRSRYESFASEEVADRVGVDTTAALDAAVRAVERVARGLAVDSKEV